MGRVYSCNALWYCHWWPRLSVRRTSLVAISHLFTLVVSYLDTVPVSCSQQGGVSNSRGGKPMASPSNASVAFQSQKLPIPDKYQDTPTLFHSADLQSAITAQICASGRQRPDKTAQKVDSDRESSSRQRTCL